MNEIAELLKGVDLFSSLTDEQIENRWKELMIKAEMPIDSEEE